MNLSIVEILIGIGALLFSTFLGSAEGKSHSDLGPDYVPLEQEAQETPQRGHTEVDSRVHRLLTNVVTYNDRSAFLAALKGNPLTEGFEDGTLVTGLSYESTTGAASIRNGRFEDRFDFSNSNPPKYTKWLFARGAQGFGADFNLAVPGGAGSGIDLIINANGQYIATLSGYTNGFFGFTTDALIYDVKIVKDLDSCPGCAETYWTDDVTYGRNEPPTAVCKDIKLGAVSSCMSARITPSDINNGSTDPEKATLGFSLDQTGPFPLGVTTVTLTVSDGSLSSTCQATVTVTDNEAPVVDCGSVGVIAPCQVPVQGSFNAAPKVNGCNAINAIAQHGGCFFCNGANKQRTRDCVVSTSGNSFLINDTGGVQSHVVFTVTTTNTNADSNGVNLKAQKRCTICTQNPSVDFNPGCSASDPSNSNGYVCKAGFPQAELTCGSRRLRA